MSFPAPTLSGDVAVVPWPSGAVARARARATGTPRLLVVASGAPPPDCDRDEDWASERAPTGDIAHRVATLAGRPRRRALSPAVVAALSDATVAVYDALARAHPRLATTAALVAAAGSEAVADRAIVALRGALRSSGYDVLTVTEGAVLTVPPTG